MAFAMKDKGWTREEAYRYVKEKRSVVNPNEGFWKQLATYQGILDARFVPFIIPHTRYLGF